uniref:GST_C_6 domain-containing protein n=1 Tax=Globodera pallida TaxID=36090 RepID=A0A183BTR7_GLOPA
MCSQVYLSKLVEKTQYKMPPPFVGVVKGRKADNAKRAGGTLRRAITEYGRAHKKFMQNYGKQAYFVADEDTIETIMLYVQLKLESKINPRDGMDFKEDLDELRNIYKEIPEAGCALAFAPNEHTLNNALLFEQGLPNDEEEAGQEEAGKNESAETKSADNLPSKRRRRAPFLFETNDEEDYIQDDDDDDDDDDEENADETSTYAVMQAIQRGHAGFGDAAQLDWSHLSEPTQQKKKTMSSTQKWLAKFKAIYYSIIRTVQKGTGWVVNKLGRSKDTKNATKLELADSVLSEHLDKLNDNQRTEIMQKAESAISGIEQLENISQNNSDNDNNGKQQQKPQKKDTASNRAGISRKWIKDLKNQKYHPFDFLAENVRYTVSAKTGRKEYKRLDADQVQLLDRLLADLGKSDGKNIDDKKFKALIEGLKGKDQFLINYKRLRDAEKDKYKLDKMDKDHANMLKKVHKALRKLAPFHAQLSKEAKTCNKLGQLVDKTLYMEIKLDPNTMESKYEPQSKEMRGRLGAQIINSVISVKDLNGMMLQLSLSLFGSGIIALFFDAFLWPIIIGFLTPLIGPFAIPLSVALYSITPLFAETFDSLMIKRAIASSRGAPLFPKKAILIQNFHEAVASGTVASFGSIPNNLMEYASGLAWLPMLTMTNMLATATSAAMVPSEIHEAEEQTGERVLNLINKGFFPKPDLDTLVNDMKAEEESKRHDWRKPISAIGAVIRESKQQKSAADEKMSKKELRAKAKEAQHEALERFVHNRVDHVMDLRQAKEAQHEALERFVHNRVDHVMDLTKTTGMARNSMSTGIVLSLTAGFAPFYALQEFGIISANIVKIILIIFNAPTEILSMSIDRIMSSKGGWDGKKNRRMVGLIMRKAIEQLKRGQPMTDITDDEVYNVYYSNFIARRMNKFGKATVDIMTVGGKFLKFCGGQIASGAALFAKLPLIRNLVGAVRKIKDKLHNNFLPLLAQGPIVENWNQDVIYLITYRITRIMGLGSSSAVLMKKWRDGVALEPCGLGKYKKNMGAEKEIPAVNISKQSADSEEKRLQNDMQVKFESLQQPSPTDNEENRLQNEVKCFCPIVENWNQDVIYLITYPRLSAMKGISVPVISPAALKLETWMMLRKLPFYRIKNGPIVENWNQDVIYLITYPRLSSMKGISVPVISPAALKLETWLMLRKLPFYRIKNGFLLADLFGQRVPFVELNGTKIAGTVDQIIEKLEQWDLAKKSKHLMLENVTMFLSDHESDKRKELRKKERYIRRLFDEVVTRCLMYDRNESIKIPYDKHFLHIQIPENDMGFLGQNYAMFKQLVPTLPRFYPKWFNKKLLLMTPAFWSVYFSPETEKRVYRPGMEILSEQDQLVKDLRDKDAPLAWRQLFQRYKRKLYNELTSQKVREYNAEIDRWQVKHRTEKVAKDKFGDQIINEQSIKYGDLKPDQIADKVIEAMGVAATQLIQTMGNNNMEKPMMFLFGDKPTPADASLFAHLVQLFETKLHLDKLTKHVDKVKKSKKHEQHVLLQFVDEFKKKLNIQKWDQLKYSDDSDKAAAPFNSEWTPPDELGSTYTGPFELKFKDVPAVERNFMVFDEVEAEQEAEEFGTEQAVEEEAEAENSAPDDETNEQKEIRRLEKEEKEKYTPKQIVTFAMFNEKHTWEKLDKKRTLYEEPKDPGNFLWRYPKVVSFVARRILMITDCNEADKIMDGMGGSWVAIMDHGLELIEQELVKHQPFADIFQNRQRKDNDFFFYTVTKFGDAKKRAATARALFHLMAMHFCKKFANGTSGIYNEDDEQLPASSSPESSTDELPAQVQENECKLHKPLAEEQLKRIFWKIEEAKALLTICDKIIKKIIDQVYQNHERLVKPIFTRSEVKAFLPINDNALVKFPPGNGAHGGTYYMDRVLLYYYPDAVAYVLHALMDTLFKHRVVPLHFSLEYRYVRVCDSITLNNKREQLINEMDALKGMTSARKLKQLERAEMERMQREQQQTKQLTVEEKKNLVDELKNTTIARALLRLAAAFLCAGGGENETTSCGDVHLKKAFDELGTVMDDAQLKALKKNGELNKKVKHFVHQIIVNYNELIAEEELDKFSTKIVAELELLPKGPGFFERLQKEHQQLIKNPPKELEAEVKFELSKAAHSPDLQRMQQRSGFVGNLQAWWQNFTPNSSSSDAAGGLKQPLLAQPQHVGKSTDL